MFKVIFCLVILSLVSSSDPDCVYPGTCTPPSTTYSRVLPVIPRYQWVISDGFCGSVSIQTAALTKGAYISQDLIRKQTPYYPGVNGDKELGYEVAPFNIAQGLTNLKINYDQWDYAGQPQPQANAWLAWVKSHLVEGHPVVMFPMCKGDSHDNLGVHFDHVEPIWGIYSNHPLTDKKVYDDDVLQHGSDYAPDGQNNLGYFRPFNSMADSTAMDGNCKNAQAGWGKNEMYPCVCEEETFGNAVTGLVDPKNITVDLALKVDCYKEPNVRTGEKPVEMNGTILISGLKSGASYTVYRYNSIDSVPTDSNYVSSSYDSKKSFVAGGDSYSYVDTEKIISDGATYYKCIADADNFLM